MKTNTQIVVLIQKIKKLNHPN